MIKRHYRCPGTALHAIELTRISAGGTVVVLAPVRLVWLLANGSSYGAAKVVMVGRGERLEIASKIAADIVVDFEKEDVVEKIKEITGGVGQMKFLNALGLLIQ